MKKIPILDLYPQHKKLKRDIFKRWKKLCNSSSFVLGREVAEFEEEFAAYCGAKYAVGVSSGTSALHIALEALHCKNKTVMTSPFTFIATAETILHSGGKINFKDIEKDYYTINPDQIAPSVSSSDVIIPVHIYGQGADMDSIMKIASENNLKVIEDCAQAHGAEYKGKKAGTFGDAGCFSFYPAKNLGAYGEAGCVICSDRELAELMKRLRAHGSKDKYYHTEVGYNYRIDALQAAVLRVKLKYLDEWNLARAEHARIYNKLLAGTQVTTPKTREGCSHVFHQYSVVTPRRDALADYLNQNGIGTAVHYPIPLHLQPVFSFLGHKKGDFPISEELSSGCLSLPVYPEIKNSHIEYVCGKIIEFYEKEN